jgi:precorrin-6A/cobalt-precorrin-6A reductase
MRDKTLILGGTAEAAALARRLVCKGVPVVTSLAGRLAAPPELAGEVRSGGFGGVDGLVDYLRGAGIRQVVDATHPFATTISAHAVEACDRLGLPLERLARPVWAKHPGDRWLFADDMAMAARLTARLAAGRAVLLTVGAGELAPFARFGGPHYVIRLIEPRGRLPFPRHELVLGRGPFTMAQELTLMRAFGIVLVVTKASGGAATEAKLAAARRLAIPVLMVRRPRM